MDNKKTIDKSDALEQTNNKVKKQRTRKHNRKKVFQDNYNPPYSKDILDISVDTLLLEDSIKESLKKANINCVGDIAKKRMVEMYRVQNIGKKQCFKILAALKTYNVVFREDDSAQEKDSNATAKKPVIENRGKNNNTNNNKKSLGNKTVKTAEETNKSTLNEVKGKKNKKNKKGKKEAFQMKTLHDGIPKPIFVETLPDSPKYLKFSKGNRFGIKTLNRKDLIPPIYDDLYLFNEELACFELDNKYGYINEKNEVVIDNIYDVASSFSEGLAAVARLEGDEYICGYIDKEGEIVIPLKYDIATSFNGDKAFVLKDGRWGYINKQGEEVWL